jgi:hypothetical protein
MSNKPVLTAIETPAKEPPDPFDLESLRLSQDFIESAGVKKLVTEIPIRKPSPQDFVRVHPDPAYRADLLMVNLKDDREFYVVRPELVAELAGETISKTVYTAINRQRALFLWPVTLPPPDGRDLAWWRSERDAAELAMRQWVRVKANRSLGANEIATARGVVPDPEWPDLSFQEMIRIAFRTLIIDRPDHAVIKRLRGLE